MGHLVRHYCLDSKKFRPNGHDKQYEAFVAAHVLHDESQGEHRSPLSTVVPIGH